MKTSEITDMLNNYQQSGTVDNTQVPIKKKNMPVAPNQRVLKPLNITSAEQEAIQNTPLDGGRSYSDEAIEAGWGESKYDTETGFQPGKNIEDVRARAQSGLSKIVNGTIKGGITAVSTFTDTVFGTLYGVGSSLFELAGQVTGLNGRSFDLNKVVDAGVNNWLSEQTVKLMNWSEGVFPNYRTEEEQSEEYQREWWKHIGTANFIGDSLIKNFGFTVGAMGGGLVATKGIGALKSRKLTFDLMKGATAAAEGDTIANSAIKSSIGVDARTLEKNISQAAKQLNKYGAQMQIYGAGIGAFGEGTMEGLMAKNEFLEEHIAKLDRDYATKYEQIEDDVLNSPIENGWYTIAKRLDDNMNIVDKKYLTREGQKEVDRRRRELALDLDKTKEYAVQQGDRLAANTFLLNLPILMTSNTIQFGRMFSGGWKTARSGAAKVAGNIKAGKIGTGPGKYSMPTITSTVSSTGKILPKTVLYSLKNAGSEAFEEVAQGFVSSGTKNVAAHRLTAFNDDGYDPESVEGFGNWLAQMVEGGTEYLGDIKNWQEGFLGALTGLIGIPGRRWNGGVAEARRHAREEVSSSIDAANKLNALVSSEDFQNRWHGYIRHLLYDRQMAEALASDDQFSWQNANNKQLINDIITFADAGRLDDLNQIADVFGNMTIEEARDFATEMNSNAEGDNNWTKNLSPQQIAEKVGKQANNIKSAIEQYNTMYRELSSIAPTSASPEMIKEMVFTSMYIRDKENRFIELNNEVIDGIRPYVRTIIEESDDNLAGKLSEKQILQRTDNLINNLQQFVSSPLPVKYPKALEDSLNAHLKDIEEVAQEEPKLESKIQDLKKLAKERRDFYKKFEWLMDTTPEEFDAEAITPEKVEKAVEETSAEIATDEFKSVGDVKVAYYKINNDSDRTKFMKQMELVRGKNKNVDEFLKLKKKFDEFKSYVNDNIYDLAKSTGLTAVRPNHINSMVNSILDNANSVDDLVNLTDDMFQSKADFDKMHSSAFGAPSLELYEAAKLAVRTAMAKFAGVSVATNSRKTLSPTPVTPKEEPKAETGTEGYDASQPASLEPAAAPSNPTPSKPEAKPEVPVKTPTEEKLVDDAAEAMKDETPANVKDAIEKEPEKGMYKYYRTSVPEISTEEARKARKAIMSGNRDKLKDIDLSFFAEKHPEYVDIWNALNQAKAFDAICNVVEVGDEIEFIIDPSFPTYQGKYQILMAVTKDGERHILSPLSGQTSKYLGLSELRKAIDAEYKKFVVTNPNTVFAFSKKSKVWAKAPGIVDYDYTQKDGDYSEERSIVDIPAYDENAPIVFIDRNGDAVIASGKDRFAAEKVSDTFDDAQTNRDSGKVGNLYYLAKAPNGKFSYVPIRLWTEHFRTSNMDNDNAFFENIRNSIEKIADIVSSADDTNVAEKGSELSKEVSNLGKLIDISDIDFVLRDFGEGTGIAFAVNTNENGKRIQGKMWIPDQMVFESLKEYIAGLGRSIQIKKDAKGKISNFKELLDSGMITSNAKMLRPKGTDFYINPWLADKNEFGPAYTTQADTEQGNEQPKANVSKPAMTEGFGDRDDFGIESTESIPESSAPINTPTIESVEPASDPVREFVKKSYKKLPKELQDAIAAKGYSEKEFNELPDKLKDKIIRCIPI